MSLVFHRRHRSPRRLLALVTVLAAMLSVLSAGSGPALAVTDAANVVPSMMPLGAGHISVTDFPFTAAGGNAANHLVYTCGDRFCTIQIKRYLGVTKYVVHQAWGCDTFKLTNFSGSFWSRNGGSLTVHLLGSSRGVIHTIGGGDRTIVNWNPIYYVRTCNR